MNKLCIKNNNKKCRVRINKNLECCIDDAQEEYDLLAPVFDIVSDDFSNNTINKNTFSKVMYMTTMLGYQNSEDKDIIYEILKGAYFLYNTKGEDYSDHWDTLSTSFLKEVLKWLEIKLFRSTVPLDNFLKSIESDVVTIINFLDTSKIEDDFEDCLFF